MKNFVLVFFFVLCGLVASAQAPQKFNYQAIARNSNGVELTSQNIKVRISIIDVMPGGTTIYQETHDKTTNLYGLFNLEVGSGTVLSGTFNGINWGGGNKYIKTEIDPSGGTNYVLGGTTQLISVPYALSAGNGFNHYVGELYGGGVVFHVFKDATGAEHGLIVSVEDQSFDAAWSNVCCNLIGLTYSWNGQDNTLAIISQPGHTASAASICSSYSYGGFTDWYLPSRSEASLLWDNLYNVNRTLTLDGDTTTINVGANFYWTSTEYLANKALYFDMALGVAGYDNKPQTSVCFTRAIRSF